MSDLHNPRHSTQRPSALSPAPLPDGHTVAQTTRAVGALLARRGAPDPLRRHALELAASMEGWRAGPTLTAAACLHEAVAQGFVTPAEVADLAGAEAARLCVLYRDHIAAPPLPQWSAWRGRPEALKRVRLYAAAYAEPALALLCAAHMWHGVVSGLTESHGPRDGAEATAEAFVTSLSPQRGEVQSVLLPLLDMLGMRDLRDDLNRYPGALAQPVDQEEPSADEHRQFFARLQETLAPLLHGALHGGGAGGGAGGDEATALLIPHRGAFARTERSQSAERGGIHQAAYYAEVLVPTTADCYRLLQRLHSRPHLLRPIEGAILDSVARCSRTGHRSLQTTLAPTRGQIGRITLQIVTPTMRHVNRWGVAAFYFTGQRAALEEAATAAGVLDELPSDYADAWWHAGRAAAPRIDAAPPGSLPGEKQPAGADKANADKTGADAQVVVFSPLGEPFAFDPGSTVVDYAYSVHSELAEQCVRFFVNGDAVEPATVLRHMDLVALEHSPRAPGPTEAWLHAARTKKARTRIRRYLRRQSQGAGEGQQIMEGRLRVLEEHYGFHVPDHHVDEAVARTARQMNLTSAQELLAEVASGRVHADRFLHTLFADEIVRRLEIPRELRVRPDRIALAQCCRPRPGDDVVGLPYRRNGDVSRLTVHKAGCPRLLLDSGGGLAEQHPLRWRLRATHKIAAHLDLSARDEDGLLGDALQAIYAIAPRVTLFKTDASARRGIARLRFSLEADCQESMDELADRLRRLPGREVSAVRQLAILPSEQEGLHDDATGAANPYSRLPVHDPTMFFGRTRELEEISQAVDHNAAWFVLRGQKRVGKTSLLLHLQKHAWEPHVAVCAFVDLQAVASLAHANIFYEIASAVYLDLENDPRVAAFGAPTRSLFAEHAPHRLADYLDAVRQRLGTRRLVVLIDEFSRTTDLLLAGDFPRDFFDQWRSLLRLAGDTISFVTVIQQKSYDRAQQTTRMQLDSPLGHAVDISGELVLKPLDATDARRLIEWPMRNFMDYAAGAAEHVLHLTGGNPFVIQAFCNKLVGHMTLQGTRTATLEDVNSVAELFMHPMESLFAHMLDLAPKHTDHLITCMARLAEAKRGQAVDGESGGDKLGDADAPITLAQMRAAVTDTSPAAQERILAELCANDLLVQCGPAEWRFTSILFRRWLARNGALMIGA